MIGHMILRRNLTDTSGSSAAILGLKIVGGRILDNGIKGAIIEKVKKGSLADVEGQLNPGECYFCFIYLYNKKWHKTVMTVTNEN